MARRHEFAEIGIGDIACQQEYIYLRFQYRPEMIQPLVICCHKYDFMKSDIEIGAALFIRILIKNKTHFIKHILQLRDMPCRSVLHCQTNCQHFERHPQRIHFFQVFPRQARHRRAAIALADHEPFSIPIASTPPVPDHG